MTDTTPDRDTRSEAVAGLSARRMPEARHGAILTIILVSYLMIVLDISIVITALPEIHSGLGFSLTGLSWV